jgi:hypothetical protein
MTLQVPETLVHRNRKLIFRGDLLTEGLRTLGRPVEFHATSTACWRGYVGSWAIEDGRLFLVGLLGHLADGSKVGIKELFPGQSSKIFASWVNQDVNGSIHFYPYGHLDYVVEEQSVLSIRNGILTDEKTSSEKTSSRIEDSRGLLQKIKGRFATPIPGVTYEQLFPPKASSNPTGGSRTVHVEQSVVGVKKASYESIVLGIIKDVLGLDLKAAGAFEQANLHPLETRMFLAWVIEVAFRGLKNYDKHLKASACVVREMLPILENEGSTADSRTLENLFQQRFEEYSRLFVLQHGEDPSAALLRVCKRAVEHITGQGEPHIAKIVAATTYWWPSVLSYATILVDLDREGKIAWQ